MALRGLRLPARGYRKFGRSNQTKKYGDAEEEAQRQVTRFINDTDRLLSSTSADDLEEGSVLSKRLRLVEQQLKHVDTTLELYLREEGAEAEFESVLEYSDRTATCIVRLELRRNSASQQETTNHEIPVVRTQRTKLLKLHLLKFDGRRSNWQPFRELESMGVSDIAKTVTDERITKDFSAIK
ncbi:hypothetical protein HPB50_000923 [Hyalomma asiaticum]|uniref:Uncharacterized protein n=1 Tax=Hyalomma asiaticum TaxID=266040 RepID=A0ACB7TCC8_HYAAI|nr:hypothetical protein HPB50_000923 [Hyalomma asiaticum]